ncbi:MAG: Excinuclease ABC subunit C [uncultured Thermomicrobiales bacterium]|uniref:UvrABC system protein C n=1 Tax=uncultured Thermomicrobiales bacterium TaxID=1645740 RepID=A0A6J4UXM3_9BACT|nr:MAG: Excinuclease ABC subunit C [uncultured Thermomicrobiales bacterium]
MKDDAGKVIYVGKAAALRNRVRSYFQSPRGMDPKTRELVAHIRDFETIRTDTATEALILENELIKKHLPKYNVMLKDSKTYPYLKITEEEWPRIILTRRILDDGGRYFGPYTSAGSAYKTLNLLNRLFPYRKCEKKITGHDEVCLYYHMHQCTAPCIAAVDRPTYMEAVDRAALFLDGRGDEILAPLRDEMDQAADAWNFERAAELRDRIGAVEHVLERQKVVSPNGTNADILAVAQGAGGDAGVQAAFLRNGKVLGSEFFPMRALVEDSPEQIIAGFVSQFYGDAAMVPPLLLLQHPLPADEEIVIAEWLRERRGGKVEVQVPKRGEKRDLVAMVAKSAVQNLEQSRLKFLTDEQRRAAAMSELADALDLPRLPRRIECYDISNTQGTNPVASMVVFEEGRPAKKEYRRFGIKTVQGSNDFAMMAEVIKRRFKRATPAATADGDGDGGKPDAKWATLPDLVIVDGGKGQLGAALAALEEVGMADQPIAGLAKENEELFLPLRSLPVMLPRDAQSLYLVQQIRDEAHRFAVTFHRQRRSKAALRSTLDDVPGVGPKKKQALIRAFGSVKGIREASETELTAVDGITPALAAQIKATL